MQAYQPLCTVSVTCLAAQSHAFWISELAAYLQGVVDLSGRFLSVTTISFGSDDRLPIDAFQSNQGHLGDQNKWVPAGSGCQPPLLSLFSTRALYSCGSGASLSL